MNIRAKYYLIISETDKELVQKMLGEIQDGYEIISAVSTEDGVHYILTKSSYKKT